VIIDGFRVDGRVVVVTAGGAPRATVHVAVHEWPAASPSSREAVG